MRCKLRIALFVSSAALLGCGANIAPSTPPASYLNLTGDWVVLAPPNPTTPLVLPTPIGDFLGAVQSSGGSVTATLHAISTAFPQCVAFTQDLQASGTLDANGNLALSVPIAGGTATITATIATPESYTAGKWQISGGACAMPSTNIQIAEFAPATGTYTGVLNVINLTTNQPVPGTATNVAVTLVESTTPNADGQFPLSGTVTATGACAGTFPITNEVVSGGIFMQATLTSPSGPLTGGTIPTATMLSAAFSPSACGSQIYSGTLTRQ